MVTVGSKAPMFTCDAVIDKKITKVNLESMEGKYKILFFYPLDFTFVCPTELHALQEHLASFKEKNVEIMGVSVDSAYSHLAWLQTPKKNGGIEGIEYPLLADITKDVAKKYGVLSQGGDVALRGTFLIDKENIVQYAAVNNLPLGRSIEELLRIVDALKHVEQNGEVCPANWTQGKKAMKADQKGLVEYFG